MKKIPNSLKKRGFPAKLDALTPTQEQELIAWLTKENITYAVAIQRVKEKFGLSVSKSSLSVFWQRKCMKLNPRSAVPAVPGEILLDAVIQTSGPIRLRAVEKDGAVRLVVARLTDQDKTLTDVKPEVTTTAAAGESGRD